MAEANLYYLLAPTAARNVGRPVEFLPLSDFLRREEDCRDLWELVTHNFKTRGKFLTIWGHVRFVAVHRHEGRLGGFLLVSAPLNWQIDYVVVREELRGRGVAEALINETVNQALSRQVPYIMLTSREGLRGFYEGKCGFSVVGKT